MPLEEIPVFHLLSSAESKPLSKTERQRLLEELRKKLQEVKEIKQKIRELNGSERARDQSKYSPNSSPNTPLVSVSPPVRAEDIAHALEEIHVPALELMREKPLHKKLMT